MKYLIGFLFFAIPFFAQAKCEDLAKKLDPKSASQAGLARVGNMEFQFLPSTSSKTVSCMIMAKNIKTRQKYVFADDGSFLRMDEVAGTTKTFAYMLLPQEKGKNFDVSKNGSQVNVQMNAGKFSFDTATGRLISNDNMTVKDGATGIAIENPKSLVVEFGSFVGDNPKARKGLQTKLRNKSATCVFDKTLLLDASYDRDIKYRTAQGQIDFFKKTCKGTPIAVQTSGAAKAEPTLEERAKAFNLDLGTQ